MRPFSSVAMVIGLAWVVIHAEPAAAQTFDERWSIFPKANAAPSPEADTASKPDPSEADKTLKPESDARAHSEAEAKRRGSREGLQAGRTKRTFSGKASYYSYNGGKTASGSTFNRNALTAAHRSLPFGTRVRVTDPATGKSVMVVVTDRGPRIRGRVLDLSLGAARTLGITARGVAHVRADVL